MTSATLGTAASERPWIVRREPAPGCTARLFCIPAVGNGPAAYLPLAEHLTHTELCVFHLPGRERRIGEAALRDPAALLAGLGDEIERWLDLPYAILGDCSGGLVMLHLARLLRERRAATPVALFGGGYPAPQLPWMDEPIHDWPLAELADRLVEYGAMDVAIRDDGELLALMESTLRADLEMIDAIEYRPDDALPVPITMFAGSDDKLTPIDDLLAWHVHTSTSFTVQKLSSHAFVFVDCLELIGLTVERQLDSLLNGRLVPHWPSGGRCPGERASDA